MSQPINLIDILDATVFAAHKHHGQVRKDEHASPYVTHPLSVARAIADIGGVKDNLILVAAILHDTIEDTDTTADEICKRFGRQVFMVVTELTDDKTLDKHIRKHLQVIHADTLSRPARIIKLADKFINCRDILYLPPKDWSLKRRREYIQWSADVVAQIRGTNRGLETAFDEILAEAETILDFSLQPFETVNQRPWGPMPQE